MRDLKYTVRALPSVWTGPALSLREVLLLPALPPALNPIFS